MKPARTSSWRTKKVLVSCSSFFIDNSDHVHNWVKAAGKDYVNVKPVWPVCVCVATMLQKIKNTKFIYHRIYSYTKNVNLMLICIELPKTCLVILHIP